MNDQLALVHTVDFFTPVVDDPYIYGQIAVANALSDIYAMGGKPLTALNIVGFHQGKVTPDIVRTILEGGARKAREAGCIIAGGHSIQDEELKYGLAVTGLVHPEKFWKNNSIEEGDVILLTKPLGTGAISTALKQDKADDKDVEEIVTSMRLLNRQPVEILQKHKLNVHACTDVTGFGLAGHLLEMIKSSSLDIEVRLENLPHFKNALEYLAQYSFLPGGFYSNREFAAGSIVSQKKIDDPEYNILFDPQTSGGLIITLSEQQGEQFISLAEQAGYPYKIGIIGRVSKGQGGMLRISG